MAGEEVHLRLRDHNPLERDLHTILKDVLAEVDYRTKNVVFFLEMTPVNEQLREGMERANNGELGYHDVMAVYQGLLPDRRYDEGDDDRYPFLNNISPTNYASQFYDLYMLKYSSNDGLIDWQRYHSQKASFHSHSREFLFKRAAELDRLKLALEQKGKRLYVMTESTPEINESVVNIGNEITDSDEKYRKYIETEEFDSAVMEVIKVETLVTLLGMSRDEINAKHLLESMKGFQGKTEIFSHFGTFHKYLPEALRIYGFKVSTRQEELLPFHDAIFRYLYDGKGDASFSEMMKDSRSIAGIVDHLYKDYYWDFLVRVYLATRISKGIDEFDVKKYNKSHLALTKELDSFDSAERKSYMAELFKQLSVDNA